MTTSLTFYKQKAYIFVSLLLILSCNNKHEQVTNTTTVNNYTKALENQYKNDFNALFNAVKQLKKTSNTDSLKIAYKQARYKLKVLEPFLEFYKESIYKALNQPNLPTLHEDSNGVVEEQPQGFQVLEEALFAETPELNIVNKELDNIYNTLALQERHLKIEQFKDYHLLWMIRKSLIRIMSLDIVGFDSPGQQNSILETAEVVKGLNSYLSLYKAKFKDKALFDKWEKLFKTTETNLKQNPDFNSFNRYQFITNFIHPALKLWKLTVADWQVTFPFKTPINYEAESFFSNNTFNIDAFKPKYGPKHSDSLAKLGETLFYDKSLSVNNSLSCASCHDPKLYFTDGLPKSKGQNGKTLQRNSPTLYYSALQTNQFYDGRVGNLENQISDVTNNKDEFHSNLDNLVKVVNNKPQLKTQFDSLYRTGVIDRNIRNAIANYIRSLTPFNSKFDRNISGLENTLNENEINGFNLFMGKAQCATCHFAPIFNGTVPPNFKHTEFEVLGVPENVALNNAKLDKDLGRYTLYNAKKRKHAFKTSTVRNIEKTAPYMHNGAYTTLEDVMNFYNAGGGAGIGINLDNQTLPPDALGLTKKEIQDVIAFMKALTDEVTY